MFDGFFEGKRVLVTGVSGVKGAWLALELLEAGSQVIGLDNKLPEPESNFWASGLKDRITFVQGDVNDLPLVQKLLEGTDCLFHLAAVVLVGDADRNPLEAYRSNTMGTATVLEAMRLSDSVKHAVMVTTDKVYKSKDGDVWIETDPLVATKPYAVSKACAEYVIEDYYNCYLKEQGKRIGIARAGNVLVGGDFYSSRKTNGAGRIFVDCFDALAEGRKPEIFRPQFTRPYTYGLDILTGYMTLMSHLDQEDVTGEAFNFGPHEQFGVPNALLATKLCELWGEGSDWQSGHPRPEPFAKQSLAWDKAKQRLGWQPAYTFYESLTDTTLWYRQWFEAGKTAGNGSMYEFNRSLLQKHREAAKRLDIRWAK